MSRHDYLVSRKIMADDLPFYGIVMGAMRKADTSNLARLKAAFPEVWEELDARYNSAGGILDSEREGDADVTR